MKLPDHINKECFEKLRLLVREYDFTEVLTCLAYLCSYNLGEQYLLATANSILKARKYYMKGTQKIVKEDDENKTQELK
ncbi:hypothetical protein CMI47_13210 [Candidatus Pacearchaeota archaeon]|nr:hypothetical protein [Candidatus Pacearchaeota archaeon]|tara:strand:- start:345 stop:581 length:237 start_codon:yes stop_codon:yes gene_type:complete